MMSVGRGGIKPQMFQQLYDYTFVWIVSEQQKVSHHSNYAEGWFHCHISFLICPCQLYVNKLYFLLTHHRVTHVFVTALCDSVV